MYVLKPYNRSLLSHLKEAFGKLQRIYATVGVVGLLWHTWARSLHCITIKGTYFILFNLVLNAEIVSQRGYYTSALTPRQGVEYQDTRSETNELL